MKANIICYCLVQNPGTFYHDPSVHCRRPLKVLELGHRHLEDVLQCAG
jgi:hypothetical protein